MRFDVFCSLAQTPRAASGKPAHATLLSEFLDQARLADELGYECVWVAENHYSSELQKTHANPVIPHWQGEVGVNTGICQLAAQVFARTGRIDVGSAIMNIVANGGPLPAAEQVASALAWHGLDPDEGRLLRIGFAGGRFDYIVRSTGIVPRAEWESAAWPQVKKAIFREAATIFLRLLHGEDVSGGETPETVLGHADFRSAQDYEDVLSRAPADVRVPGGIRVPRRWDFEATRIVPDFRRELLRCYAGTHDAVLQEHLGERFGSRALNLSVTPTEIIEDTHRRMTEVFNRSGRSWSRSYMPRTTLVFLDATPGMSRQARRAAAWDRAKEALSAHRMGMDGTVDPDKVESGADNALIGAPEDVAEQIVRRFDHEDRLMLWFDFFHQGGDTVLAQMAAFQQQVVPLLQARGVPAGVPSRGRHHAAARA
ncbi:LLM class flavin-dependent oxidoreductase [Actinokineospora guangxiensis]|uniref:LLM class flavin-dependent oxidoreductase n=1 Tax=Actinokineospora guangxiensis TaxID=1490288 RepID=A0ABW0EVA8_9PSEU